MNQQWDETWSFVGMKQKNVPAELRGVGGVYTWPAIDRDTKLAPCWHVSVRYAHAAHHFMGNLADRLAHRIELTADGYTVYLTAVADALNGHVDNAMLVKFTRRCA